MSLKVSSVSPCAFKSFWNWAFFPAYRVLRKEASAWSTSLSVTVTCRSFACCSNSAFWTRKLRYRAWTFWNCCVPSFGNDCFCAA